jgi:hypothetical protein
MKHTSLIAAAGVVLLSNALALIHAARNRSGEVDAEIILTERELTYYPDADDSGVALGLRWIDPGALPYSAAARPPDLEAKPWLDRTKLEELGFDCHVDPADKNAYSFYNKQSARAVFVAMEYDGAAWERWVELNERIAEAEHRTDFDRSQGSKLAMIDAASDAAALRSRHPERNRVLIAPAVIRITVRGPLRRGQTGHLNGYVQEVPALIHVPRPFSDGFRSAGRAQYRVHLRYGQLLEPWVTGVEFVK